MTIINIIRGRGLVAHNVPTRDAEPLSPEARRARIAALEEENRGLRDELSRLDAADEERAREEEDRIEDARRSRRTQDELLEAVEPGKLIALGRVWDGVGERLDEMVDELRDLENGLTSGNTLSAEDVAEYSGLNRARQALTDFQVAVRDARARVADRRTTDASGSWGKDFFARARTATQSGIARINEANRANAAGYTDKQRQMAGVGARTTDSVSPFTPKPGSPPSIADINRLNRQNAQRFTDAQRCLRDRNGDDFPPRAA